MARLGTTVYRLFDLLDEVNSRIQRKPMQLLLARLVLTHLAMSRVFATILATVLISSTASTGCTMDGQAPLDTSDSFQIVGSIPQPLSGCRKAYHHARDGSFVGPEAPEKEKKRMQDCVRATEPFFTALSSTVTAGNTGGDPTILSVGLALYALLQFYYVDMSLEERGDMPMWMQPRAMVAPGYSIIGAFIQAFLVLFDSDRAHFVTRQLPAIQFAAEHVGAIIVQLIRDFPLVQRVTEELLQDHVNYQDPGDSDPSDPCGVVCKSGLVALLSALIGGVYAGSVQRAVEGDQDDDSYPRQAYVLGAGDTPLLGEAGAFLLLLSQRYDTVYVNEIDYVNNSQLDVVQAYNERCAVYPSLLIDLQAEETPKLCEIVTQPPTNIDFRYMHMAADRISPSPLNNADIYVLYPNPDWFYGTAKDSISLGSTLEALLGVNSQAFVVSERASFGSQVPVSASLLVSGGSIDVGDDDVMYLSRYDHQPRHYIPFINPKIGPRPVYLLSGYLDAAIRRGHSTYLYHVIRVAD